MPRTRMLDDIDRIAEVDRSNMLSFCVDAPKHYGKAADLAKTVHVDYDEPENIIVAGMGGSAIGGDLMKDWSRGRIKIPIEVCRDYSLPRYAGKKTLVFATSYSGETEETLSVILDAIRRRCMIVCISSGGTLGDVAVRMNVPHLLVPGGMAPRATLPYLFVPLLIILQKYGMLSGVEAEVSETVNVLEDISRENKPQRRLQDNFSKTLAGEISGTIPSVYGFGVYRAVANRLKTQINENSKNPAKWECLPELNHNEIVGWESSKEFAKWLSVIFVRDKEESAEIRRRIEVTKEIISHQTRKLFDIWSRGKGDLARMSSAIVTGDFTSVYLAVLRGVDPSPVNTIDILKKKLKKTGFRDNILKALQKVA